MKKKKFIFFIVCFTLATWGIALPLCVIMPFIYSSILKTFTAFCFIVIAIVIMREDRSLFTIGIGIGIILVSAVLFLTIPIHFNHIIEIIILLSFSIAILAICFFLFKEYISAIKSLHQPQIEDNELDKYWERREQGYLTFSDLGGAGMIHCLSCGWCEKIICFVHGSHSCQIGRQCQVCGCFFTEYNESKKYHIFGERTEKIVCPECGKVYATKKDKRILSSDDTYLFCPICKEKRMRYFMKHIT